MIRRAISSVVIALIIARTVVACVIVATWMVRA